MAQPVQGPDGKLYQFPDGTTKEQAVSYFHAKGIGAAGAAPPGPRGADNNPLPFLRWSQPGPSPFAAQPSVLANLAWTRQQAGAAAPKSAAAAPAPIYSGTPATAGRYGGQPPAPDDWRKPLTTFTHQSDTPAHAIEDVLGNIGSAGLNVLLRPGQTIKTMAEMLTDPLQAASGMASDAIAAPQDTAESLIGQAGALGGAAELAGRLIPGLRTESDGGGTDTATQPPVARNLRALVEKTRAAQKAAREAADEYRNALSNKTEQIAGDQSAVRKAAKAKLIEAQRAHAQAVADVKAANAAALREQAKIPMTRAKQATATRELQAQIETARNNALKIGNTKYNTVNAKLNPLPADMGTIQNSFLDAMGKIKGTEAEPPILKAIGKRIEAGDALTYEDLQGFYTELGNEISKGTLPGDIYTAYDTMHEAIGDDMQRIANSQGAGKQLLDARNYWRRMKQAFGKPYNPTDVATATLEKAAPDVARAEEYANRVRLLGAFDRTIPQTVEHIANLRKGLDALPKEQPVRAVVKPLPANPEPAPPPKFAGTSEELARQQTSLPKPTDKTVIDKADIEAAKKGRLDKAAELVRSKGVFGATVLTIYALRSLIHGDIAPLGFAAEDVVGALAATRAISNLMERPYMVRFLTTATPKEIASIPADVRGDLGPIAQAAKRQGIKVSPPLAAMAAVGTGRATAAAAAAIPKQQYTSQQQRQAKEIISRAGGRMGAVTLLSNPRISQPTKQMVQNALTIQGEQ